MTEEMKQETAQENPSNVVENKPESPSGDGLLQEVMSKKATIKERDARIAELEAAETDRRQKKLADEGKLQELLAEKDASFSKLQTENESLKPIADRYKQTLVDGLSTEDERKEYLLTKSVDFLEELTKEKASMQPPAVSNPQESLGAVRSQSLTEGIINKMTPDEKRNNWHEITEYFNNKT
jgi:hypothetical protein